MLLTLRYLNIQTNFHLARSSLTLRPFYARKQIFIPPYVFFKKFLKTNIHRVPLGVSIRRVVSLSLSCFSSIIERAEKHVFVFSNPGTDPGERAGRETRVVSAQPARVRVTPLPVLNEVDRLQHNHHTSFYRTEPPPCVSTHRHGGTRQKPSWKTILRSSLLFSMGSSRPSFT